MPQILDVLSKHFSSEEEFSLGLKLGVPHTIVEHYIFNSKDSVTSAGVRLLMLWCDGVRDKFMAHRTLSKALEELASEAEVEEENTLAFILKQVNSKPTFVAFFS